MQQFLESVSEIDRTALLWVSGEAGIGKSSLLQALLSSVEGDKQIILQCKLYPDSTTSIRQLLEYGIKTNPRITSLVGSGMESGLSSVIVTIRRLARIRPTLLLFEDLHLIGDEDARVLSQLLQGIAEEPVGVICTARPEESPAYGVVVPFLIDSILLEPFKLRDVDELLREAGLPEERAEILAQVLQITHGLPLMIQSVISDLQKHAEKGGESLLSGLTTVRTKVEMSVDALTAGLTANINEDELSAAKHLALLGEVFGEKSARVILKDAEAIITSLAEKGILTRPLGSLPTLRGTNAREQTWKFTHSLLHEKLLRELPEGSSLIDQVLTVVEEQDLPIYTITPFLYIARQKSLSISHERAEHIILQLLDFCWHLHGRGHWQLSMTLLDALTGFYNENVKEGMDELLRVDLQALRTRLLALYPASAACQEAIATYRKLTQKPSRLDVAVHTVWGVSIMLDSLHSSEAEFAERMRERLEKIEELLQQFPPLLFHNEFLSAIGYLASQNRQHYTQANVDKIRAIHRQVLHACEPGMHIPEVDAFTAYMLPLFATREELEQSNVWSQKFLSQLERGECSGIESVAIFLMVSGQAKRVRNLVATCAKHCRRAIASPSQFVLSTRNLQAMAAMGVPVDIVFSNLRKILEEDTTPATMQSERSLKSLNVGSLIAHIGLWCGEEEKARALIESFALNRVESMEQLHEIYRPNEEMLREVYNSGVYPRELHSLLTSVVEGRDDVLTPLREILEREILHINRLLHLRTAIGVAEYLNLATSIKPLIKEGLKRGLAWCAEGELAGYAQPLLQLASRYLSVKERREWEKIFNNLLKQVRAEFREEEKSEPVDTRVKLSVIGTVTVQAPGEEEQRIQGGRVRQILALMVANEVLKTKLSVDEFREFGTESTDVDDGANTVRVTISRIRQLLGKEGVIVERNCTPRLNLNQVNVDLINVLTWLKEAIFFVEKMRPRKSYLLLMKALDTLHGEVIYPALYNDFFAAARHDVAYRLREAVLAVAHLLHHEMAYDEESELLRHALDTLPNDESIQEQFVEVLELLGRNVEVLNLRKKMSEVEESS